jgi:hypothetical protein
VQPAYATRRCGPLIRASSWPISRSSAGAVCAPDVILGVYTPDELEEANREIRDITPAPAPTDDRTIDQLPECTDELFIEKTPEWRQIILSKKKTPAQLIAMLSTRATFTDAQKLTIESWAHENE